MMKRVFSEDAEYRRLSPEKVIKRFCEKYNKPEWVETFEWMLETGTNFYSDTLMGDGSRNDYWGYALHLDIEENYTYIALIERTEI